MSKKAQFAAKLKYGKIAVDVINALLLSSDTDSLEDAVVRIDRNDHWDNLVRLINDPRMTDIYYSEPITKEMVFEIIGRKELSS